MRKSAARRRSCHGLKNLALSQMRAERLAMVEAPGDLSVATQCALLSLNRTSRYYVPVPISAEEVAIKHRIDALYTLLWIPPDRQPWCTMRASRSTGNGCNGICGRWPSPASRRGPISVNAAKRTRLTRIYSVASRLCTRITSGPLTSLMYGSEGDGCIS